MTEQCSRRRPPRSSLFLVNGRPLLPPLSTAAAQFPFLPDDAREEEEEENCIFALILANPTISAACEDDDSDIAPQQQQQQQPAVRTKIAAWARACVRAFVSYTTLLRARRWRSPGGRAWSNAPPAPIRRGARGGSLVRVHARPPVISHANPKTDPAMYTASLIPPVRFM